MHDHKIGVLYRERGEVVTAEELAAHIRETAEAEKQAARRGYKALRKAYTPRQYTDRRCNTNLLRFTHCPFCGAFLDWKEIREELT